MPEGPTGVQFAYNSNALFYLIKARETVPHGHDAANAIQKAKTWVNAIDPDAYQFTETDPSMPNPEHPDSPPSSPTGGVRIMLDSTNAFDIPEGTEFTAGYVDGRESAWTGPMWERFPNAKRITVLGTSSSDIADVEAGDMAPPDVAPWLNRRIGGPAVVYIQLSRVRELLNTGVMDRLAGLWVAHWTGREHLCSESCSPDLAGVRVLATQFASPETGSGGHYDLSLLSEDWN